LKDETKSVIKVASVYSGIITGAGFASGQELFKFFASYDWLGVFGFILSGVILAVSGWAVMDICVVNSIKDYNTFIKFVLGKKLGNIIDFAISIFIFVLFCAMLSGAGALGVQAFSVSFGIGVVFLAAVCFVALNFDLKAIIRINVVLVPLMIAGGMFFGIYTMIVDYQPVFLGTVKSGFVWSGVVYASYNVITSVSVLSSMGGIVVTNRRIAKRAGLLGGLCMSLLGLSFVVPLIINFDFASVLELPMLGLAERHGGTIELIYIIILIAAILTTALSNAFAVVEWIRNKTGVKKIWVNIAVCTVGIAAAHIGFSSIVGKVYPLFGYIGLFELVAVIICFLSGTKRKN